MSSSVSFASVVLLAAQIPSPRCHYRDSGYW
jgi:hypothetical protein